MECFNITETANTSTPVTVEDSTAGRVASTVKYYVMDIAVPSVCALGLVGNLLSLMVLTTEKLHRTLTKMEISAHIGLMALAVSDFLFCLLVLIFTQVSIKPYYEVGESMIYFELLADGLITIFIISSTWLIVVMAAERYIAVCHPLRARKLISLRRSRISIVLVFVICILATIPIFLEPRIQEVTCDDGRTVYRLEKKSEDSVKLRRIMWAIFFDFIPCAALVYFNLCLIFQIRKAKRLRDQMTPKHSIIRYSSSGTKISAQRANQPQSVVFNAKNNNVFSHKMGIMNKRGHSNFADGFGSQGRNSRMPLHNGNDETEYSKFVAYSATRENKSRSSGVPSTHSTDNESRASNDNSRSLRGINGARARKSIGAGASVSRKRPSDSALNSVTATLVAVVLLFLILVSPSELLKFSVGYTVQDRHQKQIVTYVTNFMQVLNFSLNFVLYCAVNKTFRHTLHGLICCCWLTIHG